MSGLIAGLYENWISLEIDTIASEIEKISDFRYLRTSSLAKRSRSIQKCQFSALRLFRPCL